MLCNISIVRGSKDVVYHCCNLLQWSLRITDKLGTWLLSVVENCPLLGDF